MRVQKGFLHGPGLAALLVFAPAMTAGGGAAIAQEEAGAGDTVRLTIDFGNGVEKTFGALPHVDGMRVLEALDAAQDQFPGIDVEFWFNRAASTGIGRIDGVGGFPVTGDRGWLVFVNDDLAGRYVEPGRFLPEAARREMNERLTVAPGDAILVQRGEEPRLAAQAAPPDATAEAMLDETLPVGSPGETVGMWRITLGEGVDADGFETAWESATGGGVGVGQPTRGGIVTAGYLLRDEAAASPTEYVWVVHWLRQGGSPFGPADSPGDPKQFLDLDVETSFERYEVIDASE